MRRFLAHRRRFEFELTLAIVARIGIEEGGRRPDAVPGDAVAMSTMLAIKTAWISLLVAADRSGRQLQMRHVHDLSGLDAFYRGKRRLIRCAKQRLQRL